MEWMEWIFIIGLFFGIAIIGELGQIAKTLGNIESLIEMIQQDIPSREEASE